MKHLDLKTFETKLVYKCIYVRRSKHNKQIHTSKHHRDSDA